MRSFFFHVLRLRGWQRALFFLARFYHLFASQKWDAQAAWIETSSRTLSGLPFLVFHLVSRGQLKHANSDSSTCSEASRAFEVLVTSIGSSVFKCVFGISRLSLNFLTKTRWESLSEFLSWHLASSTKPPELEAVDAPKSLTMFCAVRIAPAHGASAYMI